MECKVCGRKPGDIEEYVDMAKENGEPITEGFMTREEGTYNPATKQFYCTECYIKIGMPLGTA
jgi:hypothetical protein